MTQYEGHALRNPLPYVYGEIPNGGSQSIVDGPRRDRNRFFVARYGFEPSTFGL
jgi:hypothetical protein